MRLCCAHAYVRAYVRMCAYVDACACVRANLCVKRICACAIDCVHIFVLVIACMVAISRACISGLVCAHKTNTHYHQ